MAVSAHSRILVAALAVGLALPALAGPVDPNNRFERIGRGLADAVDILPLPSRGRAMILLRNGDIRLVTGDGLANEPLAHVDVMMDCGRQGLLAGAWNPGMIGQFLYVSYLGTDGFLKLGYFNFSPDLRDYTFTEIYSNPLSAGSVCENLGGGLTFGGDGMLYWGVGDLDNPAAAPNLTHLVGKILRLTPGGGLPTPPAVTNFNPMSPVHNMGTRNPVRLATDSLSGNVWFVDVGPGENDELNLAGEPGEPLNFGWSSLLQMGSGAPGEAPMFTFEDGPGLSSLMLYRGEGLGASAGNVVVASFGDAAISQVTPDYAEPLSSVLTPLYTEDAGGPTGFRAFTMLPDGGLYFVDSEGDLYRLLRGSRDPGEPSDRQSIVPLTVSKTVDGDFELAIEREGSVAEYGLYVGDLSTLVTGGYNHPDYTTIFYPTDADETSAYSRFTVPADDAALLEMTYFLVSAQNGHLETGCGYAFDMFERPGGNQTFTCDADCDATGYGLAPGQCIGVDDRGTDLNWELAEGIWDMPGDGADVPADVINDIDFLEWSDCKVTLVLIGAEWCPPCQAEAGHVQGNYESYGEPDAGEFQVLSVMYQDSSSGPADLPTCQRWVDAYNLTYPVLSDPAATVIGDWSGCGGIPQSYLFDADGHQLAFFCGYDAAGLDTALDAALGR